VKTAYDMLRGLVGSEMCIRDSTPAKRNIYLYDITKLEQRHAVFLV